MIRKLFGLALILGASGAAADDAALSGFVTPDAITKAAERTFREMPALEDVGRIEGACGANSQVNPQMAYCTSRNVILYRIDSYLAPHEPYELAHLYGHAVQVRHGVADIALREILSRRDEEAQLRAWVEQQVDCIAGFLYHAAGLPQTDLRALYDAEPMTDRHWGRSPLSQGPVASAGFEARATWFATGQKGDLSACAVGEFGSELLLEAMRKD